MNGIARDGVGNTLILPNVHTNPEYNISMYLTKTGEISLNAGKDRSAYSGKAFIYFVNEF